MSGTERPSLAELRRTVQPRDEPPVWRMARRLSVYITYLLLPGKITPNTISWVHLAVLLLAASFIATGNRSAAMIASALLLLSYVVDAVDGELARARKQTSKHGRWLEGRVHYYGELALLVGAGVSGAFRGYGSWWLALAVVLVFDHAYKKLVRDTWSEDTWPDPIIAQSLPRETIAKNATGRLMGSPLLFYVRPMSTNMWIIAAAFGVVYEALLVLAAARVCMFVGLWGSHWVQGTGRKKSSG